MVGKNNFIDQPPADIPPRPESKFNKLRFSWVVLVNLFYRELAGNVIG